MYLLPNTTLPAKEPWHWECDKNCRATYIMNKYGLDGELARQIVDEKSLFLKETWLPFTRNTRRHPSHGGEDTKKKKSTPATTLVGAVGFAWVFLKRRDKLSL